MLNEVQPVVLSVTDACRYLGGLSRTVLYRQKENIEWVKLGGRAFVTVASLDRFIAASRTTTL